MRSYEKAIICEPVRGEPHRFIWRSHVWQVSEIQRRWVEAVPWWLKSGANGSSRAVRQRTVWRVLAGSGQRQGVYDLACCEGEWSLIAAVD